MWNSFCARNHLVYQNNKCLHEVLHLLACTLFPAMSRRTAGRKNLLEEEFLKVMQSLSESNWDKNSDLLEEEYISENENDHFSVDKSSFFSKTGKNDFSSESQNEEIFLINCHSK